MKYRVTQPFIAFGMTPQPHDIIELTPEQAKLLADNDCVVEYELKVKPLPENKAKKKPSPSSRRGRRPAKKTQRKSKATPKK